MMLLVSGDDTVSPPEDQRRLFYMISGPKRMEIAPGKSHFNVLTSEGFEGLMDLQVLTQMGNPSSTVPRICIYVL